MISLSLIIKAMQIRNLAELVWRHPAEAGFLTCISCQRPSRTLRSSLLRFVGTSRTTRFPPFGSGGRIRRFRNKITGRRAAPKAAAKDYYAVKVGIISRISKLRAKLPTMAADRRLSVPAVRSTCDRSRNRRKKGLQEFDSSETINTCTAYE